MLLIECPRYLFPFARQVVASATADGGFYPPFMLDPIDFAGIYVARQQQIAAGPKDTGQGLIPWAASRPRILREVR